MPLQIFGRDLFPEVSSGNADIYQHLGVTLLETVLAFVIGTVLGLVFGLWLALAPDWPARSSTPTSRRSTRMPRVILAPIFAVWFGLGIGSKVALGVTLVFFIVFFNVYQGVKEVSPVVLANARMLGATPAPAAAPRLPAERDELGVHSACTPRSAWPSSARWSASTWARRAASAT